MRDFRMTSHFAMYSGVSEGAVAALPLERSPVGAERVGGGGGAPLSPLSCAVGAAPRPAPPPRGGW